MAAGGPIDTAYYVPCKHPSIEYVLLCFVVSSSSFVPDGFSVCSSVSNAVWFSALIVGLEIGSHGWEFLGVSWFVFEESSTTPFASEELQIKRGYRCRFCCCAKLVGEDVSEKQTNDIHNRLWLFWTMWAGVWKILLQPCFQRLNTHQVWASCTNTNHQATTLELCYTTAITNIWSN